MKRHELIFWIIKLPLEFGIVFGSFFLARNIRLVTDLIPRVHLPIQTIDTGHLLGFALSGALLTVLVFAISGLYRIRSYQSRVQELLDVVLAQIYWFFIYIAILYLSLGFVYTTEIPRLIILFSALISLFAIFFERSILDSIQSYMLDRGILEARKLVVFLRSNEPDLLDEIRESSDYSLIGYANTDPSAEISLQYIGWKAEIIEEIRSRRVEEILLVHSDFSAEDLREIFEYSRIYGVRYRYVANRFESDKMNTELGFFGKIPVVEIRSIGLTPWGRVMKRTFDIVFSAIALIFFSPLLLLVAIMVFSQDGFSPIYRSRRVGKDGVLFDMYKFRSMKKNADDEKQKLMKQNERKDGPLFKIENDPRITRFGKFIRMFDIDELPQLWNVLVGDMSLIGPRPHLPEEVHLYREYQKRLLTLKPGITGMAQTHGRHKNAFDDEVRLDTFYIENWNLLLDLKILFKTIGVVVGRKGR